MTGDHWLWAMLASLVGLLVIGAYRAFCIGGAADDMAEEFDPRRKRIDPDYNPEDRHG